MTDQLERLKTALADRYTNRFAGGAMQKWWEMGDAFWAHYVRGW